MSTEAHKALIRRYWREASTRGLLAVLDDYFVPGVVAHPPASASPAPIRGLETWKRFTSALWGGFPDLTIAVEDVIAEGDRVAVRLTARGTHTGPLMGVPPTGRPVSFPGMELFRLQDGKIVEAWGQFDALGLLQQLGAIPDGRPAAAPDRTAAGPPRPAATAARGAPITSLEAHKTLVHRAVDAFNEGDWDAVDRLFAHDYVDHDRARVDLPPGPAGVKQAWATFRAAFPDLEAIVEDVVAEGDRVAVRGQIRGTHRGELLGIPPMGRMVTVTLIDVNRIADGKLAERWAVADMLGLIQQLGAIPGPGQPGA